MTISGPVPAGTAAGGAGAATTEEREGAECVADDDAAEVVGRCVAEVLAGDDAGGVGASELVTSWLAESPAPWTTDAHAVLSSTVAAATVSARPTRAPRRARAAGVTERPYPPGLRRARCDAGRPPA